MITEIVRRYFVAFLLMLYIAFAACLIAGLFMLATGLDLLILWRP